MGLVCLNKSHDTPHFAYNSLKNWWNNFGNDMYPNSKELHIYLDCGGSNGIRLWLWKFYLQKFADETGLSINVVYYPQGT